MHVKTVFTVLLLALAFIPRLSWASGFENGWYKENPKKINTFVEAHKNKNEVAVFDWDNTIIKNDIGDATLFWMLTHNLIYRPATWKITSPFLTPAAIAALDKNCPLGKEATLPTATNTPCANTILSIYSDGRLAGKGPAWKKTYNPDTLEPAYAWVVSLMAGYTPDEIRKFASEAIEWSLAQPVQATYAIRIYTPMQDLISKLQKNGFDVWVLSASSQYLVETFAKKVGIPADHVIGVRAMLDSNGKTTPRFEGCGAIPDNNQILITYRLGKRCWADKLIKRPIAFAAGDSDTDISFVKDATDLRLAINRNKNELMCNAYHNPDGKWIINPMFILPKSKKTDRYSCLKFDIPDQEDTIYGH